MEFTKEGIKHFIIDQKCIPWRVKNFFSPLTTKIKDMTGHLYDQNFFDSGHRKKLKETSVKPIVNKIMEEFKPRSLIDVGCGDGLYLEEFLRVSVDVFGLDYSHEGIKRCQMKNIPSKRFNVVNDELNSDKRYDLCLCFEIAEHIPTAASSRLVKILTSTSDTIVFTAAVPGQGGHHHINEQPKEFWLQIFTDNGYRLDDLKSQDLKDSWAKNNVLDYMYNNVMVFRKELKG